MLSDDESFNAMEKGSNTDVSGRKKNTRDNKKCDTDSSYQSDLTDDGEASNMKVCVRAPTVQQAADRKVISLVKARPLLYTRNNMPIAACYKRVKKLWQEVANAMGWKVSEVRRKWSHIRNSYSRHLRNEMHGACTGRGRVVSKWYLADEMGFLRRHMATDTRMRSFQGNSLYTPAILELPKLRSPPREEEDIKPIILNPWTPTPHINHDTNDGEGFTPEENTSYFQFFRGIHSEYQELPVSQQRLFQRQCLTLLHRLLDEQDRLPLSMVSVQEDPINLSHSSEVEGDSVLGSARDI